MASAQSFTLRVAIMNDHASSLSAWLSALDPARDAPATVLHIDRHADLATPRECDAHKLLQHDTNGARCADRAGFQLAAAWLGLVDRVWWLKPGRWRPHSRSLWRDGTVAPAGRRRRLLRRADADARSPSSTAAALAVRVSGLHELAKASAADIRGPLLLDIDLDFWGGAAGPQMPTWELASLGACAEYLRECGAAAWGDMREVNGDGRVCPTAALWPSLLGHSRDGATGGGRGEGESEDSAAEAHGNVSTLLGRCAHALRRSAPARPPYERLLLRRAHALGLTPPEALLAAAPASGAADSCGRVASRRLVRMLRSLWPARPRLLTIARSIDGFLPFRCAERLEAAVLRAVRMAFNATKLVVEYMPGTAPAEALRGMSGG